jgi:hypothetical protein
MAILQLFHMGFELFPLKLQSQALPIEQTPHGLANLTSIEYDESGMI